MTEGAGGEPLVPISLVAHWVFCPRRAWLEASGETTDTVQMAVGTKDHRATDDPSTDRAGMLRAVDVRSERLGIVGRCDTIEIAADGRATVVEYKATPVRRRPEVTDPMKVQVVLQVAALRDMGVEVAGQAVYFTGHKVRKDVSADAADVVAALEAVRETVEVIRSDVAPPPLEDDPRCSRCSHASVCLPDERPLQPVRRRIIVSDPDTQALHLTTPGSRASTREGRIIVRKDDQVVTSVPIERVQSVVIHGNVDLTGGLIRELLWRSLPVVWCSSSGRVVGWASSASAPNGISRVRQHVASARGDLELARQFVSAKITNQATLLRRLGDATQTVSDLRASAKRALSAASLEEVLGVEGEAAARYFAGLPTMLKGPAEAFRPTFEGRNRRPSLDPVNATVNFYYALLLSDVLRAVIATGLDPHAGFLHSSARNKPALALDLCEEFRAPVADSAAIGAFNNGEIKAGDFSDVLGVTKLRPSGRKALITAYERRATSTFRHPTFGYEVTWRRAMEVQARLILGVIEGTQASYKGVVTR